MTQVFQPPLIPAEGGSALPSRSRLNFAAVASVTDDAVTNETDVSVTGGGAGSATSQEVSVGDAALSIRIDTQSQSISVLSQAVSVISQQVSALSQAHSVLSQAVSVLSSQVSVVSVAA